MVFCLLAGRVLQNRGNCVYSAFLCFFRRSAESRRMRPGAGSGRLLRVVRNLGFWWRHRFPDLYRAPSARFRQGTLPRCHLVYIFDGDRGAGGSGTKAASGRKKIPGRGFLRCSVIASDMGFPLFIEPHLGFDHFRIGDVHDYYVVSIFKINPFSLKNRRGVLRFQGF